MVTEDGGFRVKKLTGETSYVWKHQIEMALIGKD